MPTEKPTQEALKALIDEARSLGSSVRRIAQALDCDPSTIHKQIGGQLAPTWMLYRAVEREVQLLRSSPIRAQAKLHRVRMVPVLGFTGGRMSGAHGEVPVPEGSLEGARLAAVEVRERSEVCGLEEGDLLLFEQSVMPDTGEIAVISVDGLLEVRRVEHPRGKGRRLVSDHGWDNYETDGIVIHGTGRKRMRLETLD